MPSYEKAKSRAVNKDSFIREQVALDRRTPPEILFFLAQDIKEHVRLAVAKNEATPWQAHTLLSEDSSLKVRLALLENISQKFSFGQYDADLKRTHLDKSTESILKVLESLAQDTQHSIRKKVSEIVVDREKLSIRFAPLFAEHPDTDIQCYFLRHAAVLEDGLLLALLENTEERSVPLAIACRHYVSAPVVEQLVTIEDKEVLETVLQNEGATLSETSMHTIAHKVKEDPHLQNAWHKGMI